MFFSFAISQFRYSDINVFLYIPQHTSTFFFKQKDQLLENVILTSVSIIRTLSHFSKQAFHYGGSIVPGNHYSSL